MSDCMKLFKGSLGQGRGSRITLFLSIIALINSFFFFYITRNVKRSTNDLSNGIFDLEEATWIELIPGMISTVLSSKISSNRSTTSDSEKLASPVKRTYNILHLSFYGRHLDISILDSALLHDEPPV